MALNFVFNPHRSKYTNIFQLPLKYTFRYRIEKGSLTTYKYRNNELFGC